MKNAAGFSLIEILVALTLLALTGSFVANKIFDIKVEGEIEVAKTQMSNLKGVLQNYRRKCGSYPTTEQGLNALLAAPTIEPKCKSYPPDGFIEDGKIPLDPWDEEYFYQSDGRKLSLYTYGPDRSEGGENYDQDIHLKDL